MENALTISTLPIRVNEKLTIDARARLTKIIETEFDNKESLYHQVKEDESKKVIAAYQKKVGFPKLLKQIEDIEAEERELSEKKTQVEQKMRLLGLDRTGSPRSENKWDNEKGMYVKDYAAKELNTLLNTIQKNGPTQNLKSKLLTRITLATTIGEANVIMREVLGNGLIQSLNADDLKEV